MNEPSTWSVAEQQGRALDCAATLRIKASEYRQMGFKNLGAEYLRQARLAERWAANLSRGPKAKVVKP